MSTGTVHSPAGPWRLVVVLCAVFLDAACAHVERVPGPATVQTARPAADEDGEGGDTEDDGLRDQELAPASATGPLSLPWEDLTSSLERPFQQHPDLLRENGTSSFVGLGALPSRTTQDQTLARLVLARKLNNPIPYDLGVFGLAGNAKLFVATQDQIRDYDRLYWVMVKVLSEKYGCFMVAKSRHHDVMRITCRDRRQIVFWRSRGPGWIQFYGRQFDRDGYEIAVKKRKIVRLSARRVI